MEGFTIKYAKQMINMMNALRNQGIETKSNGVGMFTANGYYVETSSVTNIYKGQTLVASYKTPKSALNFLLKA